MDNELISVEVRYIPLDPTSAERLKVEEIIKEQPGNWQETFAGLPANLQERIKTDPDYCPTDAVLDASLQNHGYGFPPEVKVRMYEDFARFLSDCGIPQDAPNYPYTTLAEQFLDSRIESPMLISPVEPEIDLYGEAGEPALESPPGIIKPQELQQVEVIEQPEPKPPSASVVEPAAGADQLKPTIEKLRIPSLPSREFNLLPEVKFFDLPDGRRIELRGEITHGSYADVYIGRYPGEETDTVVLKIAKDQEGMRELRERFGSDVPNVERLWGMYRKEAETLNQLHELGYQFVPRVHYYNPGRRVLVSHGENESNFFDDRPYIVMDLAKGLIIDRLLPLGEHINYRQAGEVMGSGIDEQTALEIVRQVTEDLDLTLRAGYNNTDIKGVAENIYWDPESNKVVITDWNESYNFLQHASGHEVERTNEAQTAYLWVARRALYYLLTGEALTRYNYLQPVDRLKRWDFFSRNSLISPGTQTILQKAFDRTNTYPDLASLKADLDRQLAVLGVPGSAPAATEGEAKENLGQERQRLQARSMEVAGRLQGLLGTSADELFRQWLEENPEEGQ